MKKSVKNIIERVQKKKALGVLYNISKDDEAKLRTYLFDMQQAIIIRGADAYDANMLINRLKVRLKIKGLTINMLPAIIGEKIIAITGADIIRPSYNRIVDDCYKYKIPLLLLMNTEVAMIGFRDFPAYKRVLTIEQNFEEL